MAFVPSFNSRLLVGSQSASVFTRGFNFDTSTDQLEVTCLPDTAKVFTPGLDSSTASIDVLIDGSGLAGSEFATLNTWKTVAQPVSFFPEGTDPSKVAWLLSGNESQFTVNSTNAGVVDGSVSIQTTDGIDAGVSLDALASISITTTSANVDNGAASSNGGVAHLHVTAFSGLTSDTVTIQHSVDGSTGWATLVTFTAATAITGERVTVAAATTVRRYLRVVDTLVGVGSVTTQVSFARR